MMREVSHVCVRTTSRVDTHYASVTFRRKLHLSKMSRCPDPTLTLVVGGSKCGPIG